MLFSDVRAVTPHDSTPVGCHGFICGGAGSISIVPKAGGAPVTFPIVIGQQYFIACYLIRATGTTATNIVACFA